MKKIRVFLAHREKALAHPLEIALQHSQHLAWAGWGTTKDDLLAACQAGEPLVVLLDTNLPDLPPLQIIPRIISEYHSVRFIGVLQSPDGEMIRQLLRAGASGCVLQSEPLSELLLSLPSVMQSKTVLSSHLLPLILG